MVSINKICPKCGESRNRANFFKKLCYYCAGVGTKGSAGSKPSLTRKCVACREVLSKTLFTGDNRKCNECVENSITEPKRDRDAHHQEFNTLMNDWLKRAWL